MNIQKMLVILFFIFKKLGRVLSVYFYFLTILLESISISMKNIPYINKSRTFLGKIICVTQIIIDYSLNI